MSALRRARARLRINVRRRRQLGAARDEVGRRAANTGRRLWLAARRATPFVAAISSLPIVLAAALVSGAARVLGVILRAVDALSVIIRPEYAIAAVAAACCAALVGSQFVDYTGVAVDAAAYGGRLGSKVPAPIAAPHHAGPAHAYAMIPLAAVALLLTLATMTGRWRFGRLVALCGAIGIAIALLIDLPKGLDAGRAGLAYSGTEARLEGGFYVELTASAMLLLSGVLLSRIVHSTHPEPGRSRRRLRGRRGAEPAPMPGTLDAPGSR
jgi:hypothetical protein